MYSLREGDGWTCLHLKFLSFWLEQKHFRFFPLNRSLHSTESEPTISPREMHQTIKNNSWMSSLTSGSYFCTSAPPLQPSPFSYPCCIHIFLTEIELNKTSWWTSNSKQNQKCIYQLYYIGKTHTCPLKDLNVLDFQSEKARNRIVLLLPSQYMEIHIPCPLRC